MSRSTAKDLERILSRCEINDCWQWLGAFCSGTGYGKAGAGSKTNGTRRVVNVHRFVYETLVGKLPSRNVILDHLCRNKLCCNPDHLEPVNHSINALRGFSPLRERTHCMRGHEFNEENTSLRRNGGRNCRACMYGK